MSIETRVAEHYTRGRLEIAVLQALEQAGKDVAHLTPLDLAAVDEFHVGGLEATRELAAQMELSPGLHLLDVGSGIGGPARYFAAEHGCNVSGIDVTEEFVQVANRLTKLVNLDGRVEFRQGSALDLPFDNQIFDRAYMIHVGMNIADKTGVYREVRRVLKPGGLFVIFDIVRTGEGPIAYPVPWSQSEETSFLADRKMYGDALEAAGFRITHERGRRAFAIQDRMERHKSAQDGGPAVGLQLLMGDKAKIMSENLMAMMQQGLLEPVEIFSLPV